MGNTLSIRKINCEDMQKACNGSNVENYIIINTLDENMQKCLIKNTIQIEQEEKIINSIIKKTKNKNIILYGRNCNDEKTYKKYEQLVGLGFTNVYIYVGGMFEWMMPPFRGGQVKVQTKPYLTFYLLDFPIKSFHL